jgi:DNA-directed RNA polymerase subunit RPC12/RpoP
MKTNQKKYEAIKRWREQNPDKLKEQQKRYYEKHKEERGKYCAEHYREIARKAKLYDQMMAEQKHPVIVCPHCGRRVV